MAISFPISPTLNQTYTVGTKTWVYNGYAWDLVTANLIPTLLQANAAFDKANSANVLAYSNSVSLSTNVNILAGAANANSISLASNVSLLTTAFVGNTVTLSTNVNQLAANVNTLAGAANANAISLAANVSLLTAAFVSNSVSLSTNVNILAGAANANAISLATNVNLLAANVGTFFTTFVGANANGISLSTNVNQLAANVNTLAGAANANAISLATNVSLLTAAFVTNSVSLSTNVNILAGAANSNSISLATNVSQLAGNVGSFFTTFVGANANAISLSTNVNQLAANVNILAGAANSNAISLAYNVSLLATAFVSNSVSLSTNVNTLAGAANANAISLATNVSLLTAAFVSNTVSLSTNVSQLAGNVGSFFTTFVGANANNVSLSSNVNILAGAYAGNTVSLSTNVGQLVANVNTIAGAITNLTLENLPGAFVKRSVTAATTANIALFGTQTIDGVALVAGNRILVKDQTLANQNGIYIVAAGAWSRSADADVISDIASAMVAVDSGTTNGGKLYDNDVRTTDILETSNIIWNQNIDDGNIGTYISIANTRSDANDVTQGSNIAILAGAFVSNTVLLSTNVNQLAANVGTFFTTFVSANANNVSLSTNVNQLAANVNTLAGAANANSISLATNVSLLTAAFVTNSVSLSTNVNQLAANVGTFYTTFVGSNANTVSLSTNVNQLAANVGTFYTTFVAANANSVSLSTNVNLLTALVVGNNASQGSNIALLAANVNSLVLSAYNKSGGTISGDVAITGSLTISGTTTYVNTQTLLIGDNLLVLNADIPGNITATENAGLEVNRGNKSGNAQFLWIEAANAWGFTGNSNSAITTYIVSNTDFVAANTGTNIRIDNLVTDTSGNNVSLSTNVNQLAGNVGSFFTTFVAANANNVSLSTNVNQLAANVGSFFTTFVSANANTVSLSTNVNTLAACTAGKLANASGTSYNGTLYIPSGSLAIGAAAAGSRLTVEGGSLATSGSGLHVAGSIATGRLLSGGGSALESAHTFFDSSAVEISAGSSSGYVSGIGLGARSYAGTGGDAVTFWTRSSERVRINLYGDVGIGITSPTTRLHVNAACTGAATIVGVQSAYSNTYSYLQFLNSAGSEMGYIGYGNPSVGQMYVWQDQSEPILIGTNNAVRMTVGANGNVGIGQAASATYRLGVTSPAAGIGVTTTSSTSGLPGLALFEGAMSAVFATSTTSNTVYFGSYSSNTVSIITGNSTRLTIGADGGVGIGTTTLQYSASYNTLSISGTTGGQVAFQTGGVSKHYIFTTANDLTIGNYGSGNTIFSYSGTERMRIDTAGNVGIGTSLPVYKLEVNGNFSTSNLISNIHHMRRIGSASTGINWYSGTYTAWQDYMAPAGAGQGWTGTVTAPSGTYVTSWARRSFVENAAGYGWTWEAGSGNSTTPTIIAELSSATGNFRITGGLYAVTKSFEIDHPTKPGMKLRYGSLEGPENGVYVRGKLDGSRVIELPDYWEGLVDLDSITVQLTAIGRSQNLYVAGIDGLKIHIDSENHTQPYCYYHVYAERKDVEKLVVEYVD